MQALHEQGTHEGWIEVREACRLLGISRQRVHQIVRRDEWPMRRRGGVGRRPRCVLVRLADVERRLAQRQPA